MCIIAPEICEPTSACLWNGEKFHSIDEKFETKTKCGNLIFVSTCSIRKIFSPCLRAHRLVYINVYIKIQSLATSNSLIKYYAKGMKRKGTHKHAIIPSEMLIPCFITSKHNSVVIFFSSMKHISGISDENKNNLYRKHATWTSCLISFTTKQGL